MFSLPLLYTMEVWWAAFSINPGRLLAYVLVTLLLLLGYNRFAGLREDASFSECAIDSIEEMGIGLVLAAFMLWMLGRLEGEATWLETFGKIVMEGMTVAIGVSVGTAQLGGGEGQEDTGMHGGGRNTSFPAQMAIAACGAVLFAANVAPTEEVLVIAVENPPWKLLVIAAFSLAISGYVLYFSEFRGSGRYIKANTRFKLVRGVISTYAIALVAGAGALFFYGRFDGEMFHICLAQTVVLGLAASLGASAGRLLLQCH